MTREEAIALAEWVKDHDTRYEAKAMTDMLECYVLLTQPVDGTQLEPVYRAEEYGARHVEQNDPGPTIREAWDKWRAESAGQRGEA